MTCVFLVRNRLWWFAPLFAVANLWLSYVLMAWVSAYTPRAGVGDWTPFIYGTVAGAMLSLAACGAVGVPLVAKSPSREEHLKRQAMRIDYFAESAHASFVIPTMR